MHDVARVKSCAMRVIRKHASRVSFALMAATMNYVQPLQDLAPKEWVEKVLEEIADFQREFQEQQAALDEYDDEDD
jgi:hypothetical protein